MAVFVSKPSMMFFVKNSVRTHRQESLCALLDDWYAMNEVKLASLSTILLIDHQDNFELAEGIMLREPRY